MDYNIDFISKLNTTTINKWEIYKVGGTGVMEDPNYEIGTYGIVICSAFEAWLICANKNFELHGPMSKRSSWESPNYNYRLVDGKD